MADDARITPDGDAEPRPPVPADPGTAADPATDPVSAPVLETGIEPEAGTEPAAGTEPVPDVPLHTTEGASDRGTAAVVVALVVDLATAAATVAGVVVTGSSSMLARAVHATADVGSEGLMLLGGRRAKRAADGDHPFGYGRDRYFWAFVVTLVLLTLGSIATVQEGLDRIDRPEELTSPEWAVGILGVALVAQALSLRTATTRARRARRGAGYGAFVRGATSPELPVVLLQGLSAVVGLLLALAGVGLTIVTDDPVWDAYGTVAIGVLLGITAVVLVWEMKSLLIGESASRKDLEAMRAAIEIEPDVVRVIHFRAQHLGPAELLLGAKVEFHHELSVAEVAQTISRVEANIRANVPEARVIYLEPDVDEEHRATGGYVAEHAGHIDPDDPDYAAITGQHRAIDPDDDIWS